MRPRAGSVLAEHLSSEVVAPRIAPVVGRARSLRDRYRLDPFAHIEDGHIWIEDLETGEPVQLELWPNQEDLIRAWIDLDYLTRTGTLRMRNTREEKSRRLGITWAVAYVIGWALTHHAVPGLVVMPTIGDVADSGMTTDSFFGRIRFIFEYGQHESDEGEGLPDWLRPELLFVGGNDPSVRNAYEPRAFVSGAGATPNPGRGKRYGYVFLDEFAYHPFDRAAHRSIARACPQGRLYNSTPHGEDNVYAWLGARRPQGYTYLRHHWSDHPLYGEGLHVAADVDVETGEVLEHGEKGCKLCRGTLAGVPYDAERPLSHRYPGKLTSPWYEVAVAELTDEDVASELEIDYTASLAARVYPEFDPELHVAAEPIPYDPALPLEMGIDYGVDTTAVTIGQDTPVEYRIIAEAEVHDTLPEEVAAAIRRALVSCGVPEQLTAPVHTSKIVARGDPAGEARQQATGRPLVAEYRRLGFNIASQPYPIATTIRAVKRLLRGKPKPLVVSPTCTGFIRHAQHNRWPTDRAGNRRPGATEPLNDRHNHQMRGAAYLFAWKFPPTATGAALDDATRRRGRAEWNEIDEATGRVDTGLVYDMNL